MKNRKSLFKPAVAVLAGVLWLNSPLLTVAAAEADGSDYAFNEMVQEMAGRDTGSMWFDYYVERINQQIAARDSEEPYGAAGPSGPLAGFDGYLAGFVGPDTGSMWFDNYVDSVRHTLQDKGY